MQLIGNSLKNCLFFLSFFAPNLSRYQKKVNHKLFWYQAAAFVPLQTLARCLPHSLIPRFYIYKLPKENEKTAGLYLLLEKGSNSWVNGKGTVNDTTGALGRTVGQLYSQEKVCNVTNTESKHYKFSCFTSVYSAGGLVNIQPTFISIHFKLILTTML